MKILVTGGTGYIGEYFVPTLLEKGHEVRLLVRNREKAYKIFGDRCEYFVGDVTDAGSIAGCCEGIDIVYHMVAKVGNELPSQETIKAFRLVNVTGTKNMIADAKKYNVKRFIYISSIAAMGIVTGEINEKSKCSPYLPYELTKWEAERVLLKEYKENGFPCIILRPTKIYGVGEHEYSNLLYAKLCKKGFFPLIGSTKGYNSNIYVTDFIKALQLAGKNGRFGEIYIITAEKSIDLRSIAKIISRVLDKKVRFIYVPKVLMLFAAFIIEHLWILVKKRPPITKKNIKNLSNDRLYNISKAESELKFKPEISMHEGIEKVVRWYVESNIL